MMAVTRFLTDRRLLDDDDAHKITETDQLYNTLYINVFIFLSLSIVFELIRHMKSIFMNRLVKKFIRSNRVPEKPAVYPFAWIWSIISIDQEEVLRMVGLDGYMLLRYLIVCFRAACFYSFWGLLLMAPIYSFGKGDLSGWNRYTIANVTDDNESTTLWMPVVFCYLFSIFLCQLMYYEFKHFIEKRVDYLVQGDPDTETQTYYTIMIEKLPSKLRSTPILIDFFERLFPNEIYSVELALDLNELEDLTNHRKKIRHNLEKSIALWKAANFRPIIWLPPSFYEGMSAKPVPVTQTTSMYNTCMYSIAKCCGYAIYDAIEHYTLLLEVLNNNVSTMQQQCNEQRIQRDQLERNRLKELQNTLPLRVIQSSANQIMKRTLFPTTEHTALKTETIFPKFGKSSRQTRSNDRLATLDSQEIVEDCSRSVSTQNDMTNDISSEKVDDPSIVVNPLQSSEGSMKEKNEDMLDNSSRSTNTVSDRDGSNVKNVFTLGTKMIGSGVEGLAKESLKTAEYATYGALKGIKEATRALEYLTLGAYYRISSTAFVTFKSRFISCCSLQMLLSHEYYMIDVQPAPNPKNIIWENVSIPMKQINIRRSISDGTLMVGAVFWSIVVAFISAVSNLESISQEFPALQEYSNTEIYKFFNNYLAIGVLLILLALLPFVFDFISRNYEGLKMESEIQNSIMTRYFYYQLANVFVAVGLGSIATSIHQILENPSSILSILGNSVPSFSIYFANLLITRTFTGLVIEMLRIFPLLQIVTVSCCSDKKKYTRRELRQGPFSDPPMLYGWIYPNILMVLMILVTYSCLAPFISPLCVVFFGYAYLMYKYQLLYVYINSYQAGGYMWYAVFDRTMLALFCGVLTLLCYLAIRQTYVSGPFYAILPLPLIVLYFWKYCNKVFRGPANQLSVEKAIELDAAIALKKLQHESTPEESFSPTLFRQPSLVEGRLRPAAYRASPSNTMSGDEEEGIRYDHGQSLHSLAVERLTDDSIRTHCDVVDSIQSIDEQERGSTAFHGIDNDKKVVDNAVFPTQITAVNGKCSSDCNAVSYSTPREKKKNRNPAELFNNSLEDDESEEIEIEVNAFLEDCPSPIPLQTHPRRTSLEALLRLTSSITTAQPTNEQSPILDESEAGDAVNYGSVEESAAVELKSMP